jgi:hypothetical protein
MKEELNEILIHTKNCKGNACTCPKLTNVTKCKYLGMDIDQHWKFDTHIDNLIKRIRNIIPMLYKVRNLLSIKTKQILFESWVLSQIRYSCAIYGSTTDGKIERLQKIQNKAIKVLFDPTNRNSSTKIHKENNILKVKQMIEYYILTKNYYSNEFKIPLLRSVRNSNNWLIEPLWRNSYGKRSQSYMVPRLFNKLPTTLRKVNKKHVMKKEIKKWLIER